MVLTIGQIIHHKNFPLNIIESDGTTIYTEYEDGNWYITNPDGTYEFGGLRIATSSGMRRLDWNLSDYMNIL